MFKLRTWMLTLALAFGWASLAGANPPETVVYVPVSFPTGMSPGSVTYAGNGAYASGGPSAGAHAGAYAGGHCANGVCNHAPGNISTGDCGRCKQHCPPPYRHCMEGPPRLHYRRGCPSPVCNPCTAPNWGYFQPCWNPYPWPPDWSHCPAVPPAAYVRPGPTVEIIGTPEGGGFDGPRKGGL